MVGPHLYRTLLGVALACGALALAAPALAADSPFAFKDAPGQYLDVLFSGRTLVRYMYAHDTSTKDRREETYKPYLHVFDAEGKMPITNGAGGLYPHHRGIFIGWNDVRFEGKQYDRWHMGGGEQVHQKFTQQKAEADRATFTSLVAWNDNEGKPMIEEERTITVYPPAGPMLALIDFASRLAALRGDILLKGDPEHAGVHFRPSDAMVRPATYFFPKDGVIAKRDKDLPWAAEQYVLAGKTYSVQLMNHPGNPKDTVYSAYRDYGRFGAFFQAEIKKGQTLPLRYRFWVAAGEMPPRDVLQRNSDAFAKTDGAPADK